MNVTFQLYTIFSVFLSKEWFDFKGQLTAMNDLKKRDANKLIRSEKSWERIQYSVF